MEEILKQKIALFRFECLQPIIEVERGQCERVLSGLIGKKLLTPLGQSLKLSRATLMRWLALYRKSGIEGLKPKDRIDKGSLKRLDPDIALGLMKLKENNPQLTLDAVFFQARKLGILAPNQHIPRATVYRLFNKHGLNNKNKTISQVDRRRYEAESPMDIVQSDAMHGPRINGKKSYLFAILDDHTRLILWAEFRAAETEEDLIAVIIKAIQCRGLPRKLYVDNGPAFRSTRLAYAMATLGVALIHAKPYMPQGKGKCERWFRTVRQNFLPQLTLSDKESLEKINLALKDWLDNYYHQKVHSSTAESPMSRFINNLKAIRRAPDDLMLAFRHRAVRRVSKDRAVSLDGNAYEAPLGCIGKKLDLRFFLDKPEEVEAFDDKGKSLGFLKPVPLHANAKVKRVKPDSLELEVTNHKKTKVTSGQVPFKS